MTGLPRRRGLGSALLRSAPALGLVGIAAAATLALRPPRGVRPHADRRRASAARAGRHLREIAQTPRPTGSADAAKARQYLCDELTALGFDVEVSESFGVGDLGPTPFGPRYRTAGRVANIIARRPGSTGGRTVLAASHYDSVGQGPGAADAATPIAALLEAARTVAQGPPRRNTVALLLTEGEEAGLLGAQAFFDSHPLAREVGVMINFDARGTSGPVLMFETGAGNGPLIRILAKLPTRVFASSLFDAVYRKLPNATDFTEAKRRGVPGLNFANIGGFVHYHGPLDNLDHADPRTLQHHTELAAQLLDVLSDTDLDTLRGDDAVFFSLGRGHLVHYRFGAAAAFLAAVGAGWVLDLRDGWSDAVSGLPGALARWAGAGGAATLAAQALGRISPEFRRTGDFHDADLFYCALSCWCLCAGLVLAPRSFDRALGRVRAAALPLAAASAVLTARLPGGSYTAVWPLAGAVAATAAARGWNTSGGRAGAAALAGLPAALLLPPLARLVFQGLTPRFGGGAAVLSLVALDLAAPAFALLPARVRQAGVWGSAALGASLTLAHALRSLGSARPRPDTLTYLLQADTGTARWISSDDRPSEWTRRALGPAPARGRLTDTFPNWDRDFLSTPAPALPLAAPELTVLSDRVRGGVRALDLLLRSPRGAGQLWLLAAGARVRRWRAEGRAVEEPESNAAGEWELWLHGVEHSAVRVRLEVDPGPLLLRLGDRRDGLPGPLLEELLREGPAPGGRCASAALDVEMWGNSTIVTRDFFP